LQFFIDVPPAALWSLG